jgi:CheY-like chemotaxis protein
MTRHSLQEQIDRERPRLLVVDDQELNQVVMVALLERLGCLVDVAGSGEAAVAAVKATPYDLLFMDCQMPGMDGYQATAMIRHSEGSGSQVPIVAMTGLAEAGDREKCVAAGMNDYLTKPVQFNLLEAMLRRWIKKAINASR